MSFAVQTAVRQACWRLSRPKAMFECALFFTASGASLHELGRHRDAGRAPASCFVLRQCCVEISFHSSPVQGCGCLGRGGRQASQCCFLSKTRALLKCKSMCRRAGPDGTTDRHARASEEPSSFGGHVRPAQMSLPLQKSRLSHARAYLVLCNSSLSILAPSRASIRCGASVSAVLRMAFLVAWPCSRVNRWAGACIIFVCVCAHVYVLIHMGGWMCGRRVRCLAAVGERTGAVLGAMRWCASRPLSLSAPSMRLPACACASALSVCCVRALVRSCARALVRSCARAL
eukprot:6172512-Pleurochrysis_carterae.AAC.1